MNQFIATAVIEKLSLLKTVDYLEQRAKNSSREEGLEILSKVQLRIPLPGDKQ